ncbi:MerR family transcriptional regulator [Candidatus Soleaferrea massiliensis]|uniref:MerR family transcriptional regulator n=1 Tax=Candidatus Soleaferrea massiliensis TaxID=1470354 RepID=UPI00058D8E43|nr:MerR family transcriptional regulator [Candidatus Soleaferrea massiliensis]
MYIKEVCKRCRLTKKAVEYYEEKGLISPAVLENGYRDYSGQDLFVLKEISVLRRCGVGIPDIHKILNSADKPAALERCRYLADLKIKRQQTLQGCMEHLMQDYDIEREFDYLEQHEEDLFTMKERLVLSFPGNYGLFLALHFGRFLDEPIDTREKREAYHSILRYLDSVEFHLEPELSEFMESLFTAGRGIGTAALEQQHHEGMAQVMQDPDSYLEQHHDEIAAYLDYKLSDAYRASPAYRLEQMLLSFQRCSGYQECFLTNLKILSPSYKDYVQQLEHTNERFYDAFPQAREIYE